MTKPEIEEQEQEATDLVDAVAKTANELDAEANIDASDDGSLKISAEQFAEQQAKQQEEVLKKIVEGFNDETEKDYRDRVNAYLDYLKSRNDEVTDMILGDKVINNPKDEPLIDMANESVVKYIEVQPALEALSELGKLPIYFNDLRTKIEDVLVTIQYKLASICKLSDEAEQQNVHAIDSSFVYGVTMLFTLQSSNVLKTMVNYHRQGVLDETNRDIYLKALDDNYNLHREYMNKLGYQSALVVLDSHYRLVKNVCLALPVVAEIKREQDATESVTE